MFYIPIAPSPDMCNLPHYQQPTPDGTFPTIYEPTFTHRYYPKSIVYIMILSWCYIFYKSEKYIMTCSCHYSTIQSVFTILKTLCAAPVHPNPL